MNIDPATENAIIVAEEIGLLGDQGATVDGVTGIVDAAEDQGAAADGSGRETSAHGQERGYTPPWSITQACS